MPMSSPCQQSLPFEEAGYAHTNYEVKHASRAFYLCESLQVKTQQCGSRPELGYDPLLTDVEEVRDGLRVPALRRQHERREAALAPLKEELVQELLRRGRDGQHADQGGVHHAADVLGAAVEHGVGEGLEDTHVALDGSIQKAARRGR